MFEGILDSIQKRIADTFSGAINGISEFFYISEWYTIVFVLLLVLFAIGFFFSHPWVRACLGFVAWGAITFLVGMTIMFRYMRGHRKVEPPKPPPAREREDGWKW